MRLLIDTQVLLWSVYDPNKIPSTLATQLMDPMNEIWFSSISIAEIAIKSSLGRSDFPFQAAEVAISANQMGFSELALDGRQAARLASLPWHHRDPFDRLLIAQAIEEGLRFVTSDRLLVRYSDLVESIS